MENTEKMMVDVELIDNSINQLTILKELIQIDLEEPLEYGYETFMDNCESYYMTLKVLEKLRMEKTLYLMNKCEQPNGKE